MQRNLSYKILEHKCPPSCTGKRWFTHQNAVRWSSAFFHVKWVQYNDRKKGLNYQYKGFFDRRIPLLFTREKWLKIFLQTTSFSRKKNEQEFSFHRVRSGGTLGKQQFPVETFSEFKYYWKPKWTPAQLKIEELLWFEWANRHEDGISAQNDRPWLEKKAPRYKLKGKSSWMPSQVMHQYRLLSQRYRKVTPPCHAIQVSENQIKTSKREAFLNVSSVSMPSKSSDAGKREPTESQVFPRRSLPKVHSSEQRCEQRMHGRST